MDKAEVAVLGQEHAEAHAAARMRAEDLGDYPQTTRTARLKSLTTSQAAHNATFGAREYGAFKEYFPSPDFGVHVTQLPTGKVLMFSFERIETDPTKETPHPGHRQGERRPGVPVGPGEGERSPHQEPQRRRPRTAGAALGRSRASGPLHALPPQ